MSEFRFSPNPNQAHLVNWLPWGPDAFTKAQEENKPVLLAISAVWCYWCHVMDETSYSDPAVQALLNENFIMVRVDNDHRPDINSRYNVGGWPTTAFLTGHGGLIGGATYLPPDQFSGMIAEFMEAYQNDRPTLYTQARDVLTRRKDNSRRATAKEPVSDELVDRVSRIVAGAYDAHYGGFGSQPKFPNASILRLVNHLYRTSDEDFYAAMLTKTLDGMSAGKLLDGQDGGFFRHSGQPDWAEPQHEKMLEDNLTLAREFMDAGTLLGRAQYREVAQQTLGYLLEQLYDPKAAGFRGSQGAHSEYYSMPMDQRTAESRPAPDPSCYANTNGLAATVLLEAGWKLGDASLLTIALEILDKLDGMAQKFEFSHVYTADGPSDVPAFLSDWAWLLTALLQAHGCTSVEAYLERAVAVAQVMVDRFFDEEGGGFFDIAEDPDAIGHLQVREKTMADNTTAALALLRLYHNTRNEDYRQIAGACLSAFAETYREMGEYSAEYGLAVHMHNNHAVEVTIEGRPEDPGTQSMLAAAVRLPQPNLDIKTVMAPEGDAVAKAHVCLDTVCLAPVDVPEELAAAVAGLSNQQGSPFQDIFQVFPGN
ncbi:MAG: thioredoxin domain-containing protein [SAR202 cluster bacterium]|nr:thioredoxin domain-containing protein [SAR202 cluster bacterium]